jgi:tetratricopeptide (TPR) repeat protein
VRILIIEHVPDIDPPAFRAVRCDPPQISPDVTPITPPEQFGADQLPGSDLRRELRWYLERFLDYPFPPNTDRADRVVQALQAWGTHAFKALFHGGMARDWYRDIVRDGTEHLHLRIVANDPLVLSWPWEALHDPERGYLASKCHIERQLNNVADPPPLPENLPRDRLNILLVTARPFEADVEYRSISRSLVEQIEKNKLAACVTVLRPPTFDALQEELGRRPGYYHILHFDGHGGYGIIADDATQADTLAEAVNPHTYQQGPQGCLVFETADGKPHPVPAETLSATLHEFRIPMVVLNACQSGTIDENAENAFASVAASLVRAGIRSVVAMAWSLYVSGAQQFLPAFYKRLLETGNLAEPTRAGRAAMLAHPGRVCARGTYPLKDWLVPVVYQQQPADLSFVAQAKPKEDEQTTAALPEEATDKENPYGFIGRDSAILALERALLRDPPAILIHGLGGVGKTTLARGFLQWLKQTEGLGAGCLWFTFNDIHTAEHVLHAIGTAIFGSQFIPLGMDQKLDLLGKALRENRLILVWDNFESASGNEAAGIDPLLRPDDIQLLRRFLQAIQGGRTKVLITSRSEEPWLPSHLRYKLSLGGLTGESRWEFCTAILRNLGIQTNREDPELAALMDTLDGHPLLMRAVLPRLEGGRSARSILQELQGNLAADEASADPTQKKVHATLRFVEDSLPQDLRPMLVPLALHDRFVDARVLELMAKGANQTQVTRGQIDRLLSALATAGLVRERGQAIYELHPALTAFLRATVVKATPAAYVKAWQCSFVSSMAGLAYDLAPRPPHVRRPCLQTHSINFHNALKMSAILDLTNHSLALAQVMALHAMDVRSLDSAERLYKMIREQARECGDRKGEAVACHQLGVIAAERKDFVNAESHYLRALRIKKELGDDAGMAKTYHQLGVASQEKADYDTAEQWFNQALSIEERLNDRKGVAGSYYHLGRGAEEQGELKKAEALYTKAMEIADELKDIVGIAKIHGQLGSVATANGDCEKAIAEYLKAVELFEQIGDASEVGIAYHRLGIVAHGRRSFIDAEKWYFKALEVSEKLGIDSRAADTYNQLGILAGDRRDIVGAANWFIKSLQTYGKCPSVVGAKGTRRNFSLLWDMASQDEKASISELWRKAGLGDLPEVEETPGNDQ